MIVCTFLIIIKKIKKNLIALISCTDFAESVQQQKKKKKKSERFIETDRHTDRDRQTDRVKQTDTGRQTDRKTGRQASREKGRQAGKQRNKLLQLLSRLVGYLLSLKEKHFLSMVLSNPQ